jgi:hypothetical protein
MAEVLLDERQGHPVLEGHVTLEVECVDRLYLNGYAPDLATGAGLTWFLREHLGKPIPSPAVLGQITTRFRAAVKDLAEAGGIPWVEFGHARASPPFEAVGGIQ